MPRSGIAGSYGNFIFTTIFILTILLHSMVSAPMYIPINSVGVLPFLHSFSRGLPWWLRWQRICLQCERPGFSPCEDPLEKGMATHSSILSWEILWTEEPGSRDSVTVHEVTEWDTAKQLTQGSKYLLDLWTR